MDNSCLYQPYLRDCAAKCSLFLVMSQVRMSLGHVYICLCVCAVARQTLSFKQEANRSVPGARVVLEKQQKPAVIVL